MDDSNANALIAGARDGLELQDLVEYQVSFRFNKLVKVLQGLLTQVASLQVKQIQTESKCAALHLELERAKQTIESINVLAKENLLSSASTLNVVTPTTDKKIVNYDAHNEGIDDTSIHKSNELEHETNYDNCELNEEDTNPLKRIQEIESRFNDIASQVNLLTGNRAKDRERGIQRSIEDMTIRLSVVEHMVSNSSFHSSSSTNQSQQEQLNEQPNYPSTNEHPPLVDAHEDIPPQPQQQQKHHEPQQLHQKQEPQHSKQRKQHEPQHQQAPEHQQLWSTTTATAPASNRQLDGVLREQMITIMGRLIHVEELARRLEHRTSRNEQISLEEKGQMQKRYREMSDSLSELTQEFRCQFMEPFQSLIKRMDDTQHILEHVNVSAIEQIVKNRLEKFELYQKKEREDIERLRENWMKDAIGDLKDNLKAQRETITNTMSVSTDDLMQRKVKAVNDDDDDELLNPISRKRFNDFEHQLIKRLQSIENVNQSIFNGESQNQYRTSFDQLDAFVRELEIRINHMNQQLNMDSSSSSSSLDSMNSFNQRLSLLEHEFNRLNQDKPIDSTPTTSIADTSTTITSSSATISEWKQREIHWHNELKKHIRENVKLISSMRMEMQEMRNELTRINCEHVTSEALEGLITIKMLELGNGVNSSMIEQQRHHNIDIESKSESINNDATITRVVNDDDDDKCVSIINVNEGLNMVWMRNIMEQMNKKCPYSSVDGIDKRVNTIELSIDTIRDRQLETDSLFHYELNLVKQQLQNVEQTIIKHQDDDDDYDVDAEHVSNVQIFTRINDGNSLNAIRHEMNDYRQRLEETIQHNGELQMKIDKSTKRLQSIYRQLYGLALIERENGLNDDNDTTHDKGGEDIHHQLANDNNYHKNKILRTLNARLQMLSVRVDQCTSIAFEMNRKVDAIDVERVVREIVRFIIMMMTTNCGGGGDGRVNYYNTTSLLQCLQSLFKSIHQSQAPSQRVDAASTFTLTRDMIESILSGHSFLVKSRRIVNNNNNNGAAMVTEDRNDDTTTASTNVSLKQQQQQHKNNNGGVVTPNTISLRFDHNANIKHKSSSPRSFKTV